MLSRPNSGRIFRDAGDRREDGLAFPLEPVPRPQIRRRPVPCGLHPRVGRFEIGRSRQPLLVPGEGLVAAGLGAVEPEPRLDRLAEKHGRNLDRDPARLLRREGQRQRDDLAVVADVRFGRGHPDAGRVVEISRADRGT